MTPTPSTDTLFSKTLTVAYAFEFEGVSSIAANVILKFDEFFI